MAELERIGPDETYKKLKAGAALLVCAYDDEEKCRGLLLEGAMSWNTFQAKTSSLSTEEEIIFYCA